MKVKTKNRSSLILSSIFSVFSKPLAIPIKWGMKAVTKNQLLKPRPAPPEKKRHRKMIQASRRASRT